MNSIIMEDYALMSPLNLQAKGMPEAKNNYEWIPHVVSRIAIT